MRFLLILFFLPFISFSQTYTGFSWNESEVKFKTVQMNVYYGDSKKTIFNGYKDASITIENSNIATITSSNIKVKLGGYFELEEGLINSFEYSVKNYQATITYVVVSGSQMLYLSIYYDEISKKPTRIFVSVNKNFLNKKEDPLIFILTGFE